MKKIAVLLGVFLLFSAPAFAKKDAAWVVKKAKVTEDKFAGTKTVKFPVIKYYTLGNAEIVEMTGKTKWGYIPSITYDIEATENKDGSLSFVLMSVDDRGNWAFYESAKDKDGNELKLIRPFGDVSGSSAGVKVQEYFNIPLTEEYLKNHAESGMVFRVYGRRDTTTFHVPAWYIQGVFDYFSSDKKENKN